jgi:hypothetical protein
MKKRAYRGAGILLAGLILSSHACARGFGTTADIRPAHGAVYLNVTNQSGGPIEVYAAGSGTSYRIGTVHPGLAGHFVVRPGVAVSGPVEFLARSGTGAMVRSGPILLSPGDEVDFEVGDSPLISRANVRQ